MALVNDPTSGFILDKHQLQAFVPYYHSLSEKPTTTIRFFNRGEFYTVHGNDAIFTAKEWYKTTSFIKTYTHGENKLASLTINKANFEAYVRDLLLVKHYRVEVYTGGGKTNKWTLEYKGSPGNLTQFEDLLFDNIDHVESSTVIAIRLSSDSKSQLTTVKVCGIALLDCMEQKMSLCEITDDEYFSNTEALIVQFAVKECLMTSDNSADNEMLKKIIERSGVLFTPRKRSDFSVDSLGQDLNNLIEFKTGQQRNAMILPQMNLTVASSALAAIIKYLDLTSNQANFGRFKIETIENQSLVHIDSAALNALSVIPSSKVTSVNKHHSIFGLLDRCRTSHGKRLLMQWVRQPLKDMNAINERLDIVEAFFGDTEVRQELYEEHLRRIPDFQSLAKKLRCRKASIQDCYRVYYGISKLPPLIKTLKSCNDGKPHSTLENVFISVLDDQVNDMSNYQNMIETMLDLSLVDRGEFLVKSDIDDSLQEKRLEMNAIEKKIHSQLSRIASDLGLTENKTIKLESNSQHGFFLRVNLKDGKSIQNNKDYQILDTHKAGVRFRTIKMTELNQEYAECRKEYAEFQKQIADEIIGIAVGYCTTLQYLSTLIASLDVLISFAIVAASAPTTFVRPKLLPMDSGSMNLKQARHPCLEMQDGVSYIPNDAQFQQGSSTSFLITGPNMGGKSTYIRSIGIVAFLAHIGSFVPCESAEIQILDAILARVGANDSQVKGMSTFMVEMVETSSIIRRSTRNSLVIIDELGRGTSTYEGCGIASAIIEYLAKDTKSFTLFATHFHELTLLSEEIPTIKNFHVSAITSNDKLVHLYQVKPGACDQSFGIHVAKMAKFPTHVIEDAYIKLNELENLLVFGNENLDHENKSRILKDGARIMDEFLAECKVLISQNLPSVEIVMKIEALKKYVLDSGNAYIEALLNKE